ncbi:MAG: ABC transporter ATP-binding protein [Candidatus Margulisiibacteriota bacterium]|jgi:phospholipid/cholesterol/gamma-HCH transport system ATP-binding protein
MIKINNVVKYFNQKAPVLNGISLSIKEGETVAVIGPSGCGKSTLLRLILGLIPVSSGNILVEEQDVTTMLPRELDSLRKYFGFVFQSSALFDSLNVGENIGFHLREHSKMTSKEIARIVAEKLEMVGLPGTEKLMPSELSGGMQKRISLARAIAHNPRVMLYDEPTTGLDPIMSTIIEDLINKLNSELKVTAILVTHQLSTIFRCSQRIAMLSDGKMIEAGTPEDARTSTDPVIANFINGGDPRKNAHNRMRPKL